jgi:hypothetical protein
VADAERVRLEIAFRSGQTLSVSVPAVTADGLDVALAKGDPDTVSFEDEDGRYTVVVKSITFVKRHVRESRVGFGAAG